MSRIAPVTGRRTPLLLRIINAASRRFMGQQPEPLQVVARSKRLLLPSLFVGQLVSVKTQLAPETRLLAMHLVSELNGCTWCLDFGSYMSHRQGLEPDKLASVLDYATSPLFTPAERVALEYAEVVTAPGARVSDELFGRLRECYTEQEIVELTVAIAAENYFNRVNGALGIESQGFHSALNVAPQAAT